MDFNAPSFEGFVPFKSHVSPVEANRGRARTNFLEILKEMATEATTTNVSSEGTPTLVRELENQQTFQDLLPPSMWAMPNLGYKKMTSEKNIVEGVETIFSLEGTPNVGRETESRQTLHNLLPLPLRASPNAGHEQEGQRGFNHFYMLNPLYRANQQHQQIFDLPSSSRELEVAPFLNKHGELEQRIISSQDFTTYQPPSSSTKRLIGDDGSEKKLKLNEAEDIGTRRILSPSQLIELQDQTLIYNYISANMVVPPQHLLYNNSLCSHCFSASCNGFSPSSPTRKGSVRPSHAGKSGDPEPGRCRRSDGKKWRCSKEVVADEKYCEKHRNRGRIRQRSRKTTRGRKVAAGDSGMVVPGTSSGVVPVRVESGVSLGCLVNKQEAELKNLKPEFANSSVAALFNW